MSDNYINAHDQFKRFELVVSLTQFEVSLLKLSQEELMCSVGENLSIFASCSLILCILVGVYAIEIDPDSSF